MHKKLLVIASLFLLTYSCTKDGGTVTDNEIVPDSCFVNISCADQVMPIINTHCALTDCHVPTGYKDLTTWANLKAAADNGTLKTRINSKNSATVMPPSYSPIPNDHLTACEKSKINSWLKSGAPNN